MNLTVSRSSRPLRQPRHAVLRLAVLSRPVLDDDFAGAEAFGRGQHRHEAVQLAVEPDFVHHLAAKGLQAAVVIVQMDAREPLTSQLKTRDGSTLCQGIVPLAFPAADDVVAFVELGEQRGDFGRVVLQVAVDRDDALAFGGVEAGAERGRLAEIAAEADAENPRIVGGQLADRLPGAVVRAVVDDDDLQLVTVPLGGLVELAHQLRQVCASSRTGMMTDSMVRPVVV